ncbi:YbhB/YbcL family Raf kinase inhibitor-like protein [Rubellimicrobium roseum]|uniref:YbhB/YbcL family Raf kinase inhibitor-like protein n=1 Tax=Rubellimicrobium roseum TaxID=687525 RepID=A0A5C4NDG4_9RHOB|nr:YbhB/YbcL family Raf kinase inhibitor-like protein [Rubellimicrobium roseum]TNC66629.1 YbhB/YbcL family Raf kinase inhibitor-like protein [Rubellimicrobium roseum]
MRPLMTTALALSTCWLAPLALAQDDDTASRLPQAEVPLIADQLEDPKNAAVTVVGHVVEPLQIEATDERVDSLALPDGFEISVFARDLVNPRMIRVADDGTVYVTRRDVGDVVMLRDADGNGEAEVREVVATRPQMHGIEIDGDTVYLITVEDIYRTTRAADGTFGELERIVQGLPAAGQHPNRMVVRGPDGNLYVSVGSTCNACAESDPRHATMLRFRPDGTGETIFASGLRNTIGYAFEPGTGALWSMDMGIDWLGDNEQPEEINLIVEGAQYGWPYVYADDRLNPQDYPANGLTIEDWAAQSTDPEGFWTPHASPMQMAFYTGEAFPEDYRGDAFLPMRGSWNRNPPSGYEVVRIDFENGEPVGIEPFITGFLMEDAESPSGWGQMGRLAGLAQGPDGALYLSDDTGGVIYRIVYTGAEGDAAEAQGATLEPTNVSGAEVGLATGAPAPTPPEPGPETLASQEVASQGGPIDVVSPAFEDGGTIPTRHARQGENISPPLDWAEGPDGTQSFVLLMEDPDAAEEPPFVHWIAYNIPADVTDLPEGVPASERLAQPEGVLQGRNDQGSVGYTGPNPPVGDPPHAYHVQVFALDTTLDLPHGASRTEVLDAMEGHVLSVGETVGTYGRD